jgi:hypothetical protein
VPGEQPASNLLDPQRLIVTAWRQVNMSLIIGWGAFAIGVTGLLLLEMFLLRF